MIGYNGNCIFWDDFSWLFNNARILRRPDRLCFFNHDELHNYDQVIWLTIYWWCCTKPNHCLDTNGLITQLPLCQSVLFGYLIYSLIVHSIHLWICLIDSLVESQFFSLIKHYNWAMKLFLLLHFNDFLDFIEIIIKGMDKSYFNCITKKCKYVLCLFTVTFEFVHTFINTNFV